MGRLELDKWDVHSLHNYWKKGRLTIPEYQRLPGAWSDKMRYDLVESVLREWPLGIIMLNVVSHLDQDEVVVENYELVDGQQRMRTLFEYQDGAAGWANQNGPKGADFKSYKTLSTAVQERFDLYKVSVALLREFEQDEILDIFNRLQHSKPLRMGEKIKALKTDFKPNIKKIAEHKVFEVGGVGTRPEMVTGISGLYSSRRAIHKAP